MSEPRIRVRAYNVRFGDCILVSIPAGQSEKHILFDFGNAPAGVKKRGGSNDVFAPIAKDIKKRTGGVLDLIVMTHEHLDHMEGFYSERSVFDTLDVHKVWMSLMSKPGYYSTYRKAKRQKKALEALQQWVPRWFEDGRFTLVPQSLESVVANNNVLDLSNKQRIDYLRTLGTAAYLSRKASIPARTHGLGSGVKVEILAPEADASIYYKKLPKHNFGLGGRLDRAAMMFGGALGRRRRGSVLERPPHMAPDEFEQLKDEMTQIDVDSIFAIDKAANNTSLVVRLTVGGKVLLFSGDAEEESWAQMSKRKLLTPVDVLKIAHHGSVNGMPFAGPYSVIDSLLKKNKKTIALVSTCRGVYGESKATEIPSHMLMGQLSKRCKRVVDTEHDAAPGHYVDFAV